MAGKPIQGRHPITVAIDSAISWLEGRGKEVTPASVEANTRKRIRWDDWTFEEAASEALKARIVRRLKVKGHVLVSEARPGGRVRKEFWDATASDLEKQLKVKEESATYDRNRIKADRAVIAFLREKEVDFGYDVCPDLFHEDIDRIYRMQGLTPPGARA